MPPTWFLWFQIINTIVVVLAALVIASLKLGAKGDRILFGKPEELVRRLELLETDVVAKHLLVLQRLDRTGEKMSTLATEVQGLPERFRTIFISSERATDLLAESREDRKRLWDEVAKIWEVLHRRPRRADEVDS